MYVKTKEFRSFGAFYQKKENTFKNNFNQNDLYQFNPQGAAGPDYGYEYGTTNLQVAAGLDYGYEHTTMEVGQGNNYIPIHLNPMQYSNSFFFSLDKLKIYNSNDSKYNIFENPSFIIQYNNYKQLFCGTEMKSENIREVIQNLQNKLNEVQIKLKDIESKINQQNQRGNSATIYPTQPCVKTSNVQSTNYYIQNANRKTTIIDRSFVLSDQNVFENNYLEIYEIKI